MPSEEETSLRAQASRLDKEGTPYAVVTVEAVRGSVPGVEGGAMLVDAGGRIAGTVGGGKVEARAIEHAVGWIADGADKPEQVIWNLQRDVGMTCGGEMTLRFAARLEEEPTSPDWHVVVFGAGHVSAALMPVLLPLGPRVDVVDPRSDWLAALPEGSRLRIHCPEIYEDRVDLVGDESFVLCLSKGHSTDQPVLRELLRREQMPPYIGVIGSASKRAVLARELREDGISADRIDQILCPVGSPIGGNEPAEIAISIAAQLLKRRGDL